jgi:PiT family inorganic phosphate transporter
MATAAFTSPESIAHAGGPALDKPLHPAGRWVFLAVLLAGLLYAGASVFIDTSHVGESIAVGPFLFLGLALLIALGFEFVNGFHDTANAVATVIYTNSLPAPIAVVWSGAWNFIGVLTSSGAVAYSIVTLLPVDLILHVGSGSGYAMIFALLLAAVIWNLVTWFFGIPNSSSHALIGSILGVGLANQMMATGGASGTSGVDWGQVQKVFSALLFSPLIGFGAALVLLLVLKTLVRNPSLYKAPEGDTPPPGWIRGLLILTCTGVSFGHGSNDGQKGMGLIMLILIGVAPTAYALNRTMSPSDTPAFVQTSNAATAAFTAHGKPVADINAARATLTAALKSKKAGSPEVYGAVATLAHDVTARVQGYGTLNNVPAAATPNLRNDMYLVMDTATLVAKDKDAASTFSVAEMKSIGDYEQGLEHGTRYIPVWVKIAVALALGLGTMVGWKRIVVTVGQKIGKSHLTYAQGAAAEIVTAGTILFADQLGVPVSTTHILSSGVAGASVANGSGLQGKTILNMALAWVLTLPVAMALAGILFWLFLNLTRAFGIA